MQSAPDPFKTVAVRVPAREDVPPDLLGYQARPARQQPDAPGGGIRLFRVVGITVFLHWSWFLVAFYQIQRERGEYSSITWSIAEYLSLFAIVLLHEFGHALACRSVGGAAERILLWPFGGVAYVNAPPRPAAVLWSIAAGPLVNVALLPITFLLKNAGADAGGDIAEFTYHLWWINTALLVFNMLPIYPLDGGQILQSLLWFVIGRGRSLMVAASIGILAAGAGAIYMFQQRNTWMVFMALYVGSIAWRGLQTAIQMRAYERAMAPNDRMRGPTI